MHFHIISIFPEMFSSYLSDSILKRAQEAKKIKISFYNPRDFSKDKHKKVDDTPYGGGPGMVMAALPILAAWKKARGKSTLKKYKTIILSPGGTIFSSSYAKSSVKKYTDIIFICGRYEGIDARVKKVLGRQAEDVSIGEYILTGGELPALVMIDAMSRFVPGVLGNKESLEEERISSHEMYTKPAEIQFDKKTYKVPKVLLSGNHKEIDLWRSER
ncbi:MAG: tRNA (guanosine(37)-N1)-methyltransferase TrmD [Candidatus Pacebacteria bacterium]|nr:tRNA (guanosine(37)-N1)-methyltransferase TrmD [Candidatus Paceibacterota bacterium]